MKCICRYLVQFNPTEKTWTTEGYNEAASQKTGQPVISKISRPGEAPDRGYIFIWGVAFKLTESGEVILGENQSIGRAKIISSG